MAAVSIILLFIILVLHFKSVFLLGLFTGQWQGAGDVTLLYFPSRFFFGNSLRIGEFPLWNNNMFLGFPVHAEGQGGFFYPPNILFSIFPQWIAYNYVYLLHIFLGGLFMYLFLRSIKLKKMPSVLASVVFILSGFFACHAEHMNLFNCCIWIPLGFLFIMKKRYLLLSLVFALQFLTGFPQIVLYSAVILFFWVLFNIDKAMEIVYYCLSFILGSAIAFCQIVPTIELIPHSVRNGGMDKLNIFSWGYYAKDMLLFLSPYFFGNPVSGTYARSDSIFYENCAFVGVMTILVAAAGLLRNKKEKIIRFFSILFIAVLGLLLIFPVISNQMAHVPVFNLFRLPQRFLVFLVFAVAVISGYGFQSLKKFRTLVFLVILLELLNFSSGFNKVLNMGYFAAPESAKYLKHDKANPRVLVIDKGQKTSIRNYVLSTSNKLNYFSQRTYLNYLPPNTGTYYNIPTMNIYSPLTIVKDLELSRLAEKNAKYILSTENMGKDHLTFMDTLKMSYGYPAIKIYKNNNYISRAYFTDEKTKKLFPLEVTSSGNQKVKIEVNTRAAGTLVLSDLYYPGWKAYADGVRSKITATDVLTRAVNVNKESKKVIFVYSPLSFVLGVLITIVSILIFTGLFTYEKNTCY